jgi:hypothetical protein
VGSSSMAVLWGFGGGSSPLDEEYDRFWAERGKIAGVPTRSPSPSSLRASTSPARREKF